MSDEKQRQGNGRKENRGEAQSKGDPNGQGQPALPIPSQAASSQPVDLDALLKRISSRLVTLDNANMARLQQIPAQPVERAQYLIFKLGDARYGVELKHVVEVIQQPRLTRVPGLPGWVLGVANLHGNIISAVDLRQFLAGQPPDSRPASSMFVAQAGDQKIGLMVDSVEVIFTFPVAQIISPPFKVDPEHVAYLRGAVEREGHMVRLLDCERLLLGAQMQQFA